MSTPASNPPQMLRPFSAARQAVVARAAPSGGLDRRSLLAAGSGLLAAGLAGRADAYVGYSQTFMGSLGRETGGMGSMPKSNQHNTAEGYGPGDQGVRKPSKLSAKKKAAILAKVREVMVGLCCGHGAERGRSRRQRRASRCLGLLLPSPAADAQGAGGASVISVQRVAQG